MTPRLSHVSGLMPSAGARVASVAAAVVFAAGAAASPALARSRVYWDGGGPIYAPAPAPAPAPQAPAAPPAAPPASNRFSFGKARLNKKKGTASLAVRVPGPGLLKSTVGRAAGHRAGASTVNFVGAAGTVEIPIAASGKLEKKLERTGKVKVTVRVAFTPNGGGTAVEDRALTLVRRRAPRAHPRRPGCRRGSRRAPRPRC
jgi:hypothetical protein